jgi:thiol:disulfide interchange protein
VIRRLTILLLIVGCEKQVSEDNHNGIKWGNNLDSALTLASNTNKLIMIDLMAEWCPLCREMDKKTYSRGSKHIDKIFVSQRGTYYCKICQRL